MAAKKKGAPKPLKGEAAQRERIGAVGGARAAWPVDPVKLWSPRSDPSHLEHTTWLERTDPSSPAFQRLLGLMRDNGTHDGTPLRIYTDGGRTAIACGDRRQACALALAAERKAAGNREPVILYALMTRDPELARALENAGREDDTPLGLARRFGSLKDAYGGGRAAAMMGLRLDHANALEKCLTLPLDVQGKVERGEIPVDVAVRVGKGGSDVARKVVTAATGADGKVDAKAARKAAAEAVPPKPRALPRKEAEGFIAKLVQARDAAPGSAHRRDALDVAARVARYLLGDRAAFEGSPELERIAAKG